MDKPQATLRNSQKSFLNLILLWDIKHPARLHIENSANFQNLRELVTKFPYALLVSPKSWSEMKMKL